MLLQPCISINDAQKGRTYLYMWVRRHSSINWLKFICYVESFNTLSKQRIFQFQNNCVELSNNNWINLLNFDLLLITLLKPNCYSNSLILSYAVTKTIVFRTTIKNEIYKFEWNYVSTLLLIILINVTSR